MTSLRKAALLTTITLGLLSPACDRSVPDAAPVAVPAQEAPENDPGAAQPPALQEEIPPQQAALERCADQEESPGAISDCLANAALAADDLDIAARSAFCDQAPRQIRCEYLFATNHSQARVCDRNRFQGYSSNFRACDFLEVVVGSKEKCEHKVYDDYWEETDDSAPCDLPLPDQRPTTGDEVDELLTAYFLALSEATLQRVPGSDCPDLMRTEALHFIEEAIQIDEDARAEIREGIFAERLQTRIAYHEMTGAFDPSTWEGLRDALLLSPMHGPGTVAHVIPTDRLEFRDDGTFHLRRNRRYSPEAPNDFVESEGAWSIVSAVTGQTHAILMLDEQEYVFGKDQGPSKQYFLHPRESIDEPGLAYEFYDEDYSGEAC